MEHKDIATPSRTRALLDQYGFDFKKSLGQNYLVDVNIINKIIDAIYICEYTGILEGAANRRFKNGQNNYKWKQA